MMVFLSVGVCMRIVELLGLALEGAELLISGHEEYGNEIGIDGEELKKFRDTLLEALRQVAVMQTATSQEDKNEFTKQKSDAMIFVDDAVEEAKKD